MSRHYLVVSDLHLCDLEDHPDGWRRYKSRRFLFDANLAALVERFTARGAPGDEFLLLLNGDVFDFDLVTAVPGTGDTPERSASGRIPTFPISQTERWTGLNPTAEKSSWKLRRILSQHLEFVDTLARFLAAGHRIVYLLGNHDREFHFPEVQQVLLEVLRARMARVDCKLADDAVRFEPWFFYAPGEIYAEHGHQFDYYSVFKNQLEPTIDSSEGPLIALPMGNLSNRYLMTRMGFFNPYATDFILNLYRYLAHWAKHYLWSRRSLVFPWLWGSLVVIAKLLDQKRHLSARRGPHSEQIETFARRYQLPSATLKQINRMHERPIINRFFRIVREFWLDRLLLVLGMVGGTIALALMPVPPWLKLVVPLCGFPLLFSIYEWLATGETVFTYVTHMPDCARRIGELVNARVVTFGHAHRPRLIPVAKDVTFVDTGTWAPITEQSDTNRLAPGTRNYLIASFTPDGLHLELGALCGSESPPRS
jgi:UDP-2,3-diacylglucosamine pyrophosphatase LpxH